MTDKCMWSIVGTCWNGIGRYLKLSPRNLPHHRFHHRYHLDQMATTAYELCVGASCCLVEFSCLPIGLTQSTRILGILGSLSSLELCFLRDFIVFFVEVVRNRSYRFLPHTRYFVIPGHTPISHSPAGTIRYTGSEITAARFDADSSMVTLIVSVRRIFTLS
jgi:hypothetical protein